MKIAFIYLPGRIARLPDLRAGKIPTEFFYGGPELEAKGHEIVYLEAENAPPKSKIRRVLCEQLIHKRHLPVKVPFSLFDGVRNLLPALAGCDVAVATTPGIAFALTLALRITPGVRKTPVVGIQCGTLNYSHNFIRLHLSRMLCRDMRTQVYGEGERLPLMRAYHIPEDRITVNYFGVDSTFWSPVEDENRGEYVLSIGNDAMRDYELLGKAARFLSRKILLVTRRDLPADLPDNIEVLKGCWHTRKLDDKDLRSLYRNAHCVLVPLRESIQPSGQSVTLQAMACGTPVVLTRTEGLWDTKGLRDRENILFIQPGSAREIAATVDLLDRNEQLHRKLCTSGVEYVRQRGRIIHFAERLEADCIKALADRRG